MSLEPARPSIRAAGPGLGAALWAETLKVRRSRVAPFTLGAFLLLPLVDGLLMFVAQDPARARAMGLLGMKAQLMAATADWPTFFQVLLQGTAVAGSILFAFVTAWLFGREFADHTVKDLLAVPTPRSHFVFAKLLVGAAWMAVIALAIFAAGLGVGSLLGLTGGTRALLTAATTTMASVVFLTLLLQPVVAYAASRGRGYLAPLGLAFITMAVAQIAVLLGWGEWCPWSVPALVSGAGTADTGPLPLHSYGVVAAAFVGGLAATVIWWRDADQLS